MLRGVWLWHRHEVHKATSLIMMLVIIASLGPAFSGCGSKSTPLASSARVQHARYLASSVGIRDIEYAPFILNPGSTDPVVLFATRTLTITVTSASAARIVDRQTGPWRFASARDRLHWLAQGRRLAPGNSIRPLIQLSSGVTNLGPGKFGFLTSAGPPLTLADVRSLGASPDQIRANVGNHLAGGGSLSAPVLLKEYGFLLGWAPLPQLTRRALVIAMMRTPGAHVCGKGHDALGRTGSLVCAGGGVGQIEVLLDPVSQHVLEVLQRVTRASAAYPGLLRGRLVQSDTFVSG